MIRYQVTWNVSGASSGVRRKRRGKEEVRIRIGKWPVRDGKWPVRDGKWLVRDGKRPVRDGKRSIRRDKRSGKETRYQ